MTNIHKKRYGSLTRSVSLLFCALFLLIPRLVPAQGSTEDPPYIESLIQLAKSKGLSEDPYWWILLHYKKTIFGAKSLVDDPDFFLADTGKHDPAAELEETLRGFFQRDPEAAGECVCRFIARFTWLKEQLDFDLTMVPVAECPAFNDILAKINPKSATMIFPSSYINSPASLFGHTLIAIQTTVKSDLMSYAVNYAATDIDNNGFLFSVKGILGFYKGYFSILPYYQKVEEYSDINQRDIWEYPLQLTEEEVVRMLRHLWELQEIYSDYYFFNENCSYTLLFLLDAARPSLRLTDEFHLWVMPVDTVRVQKKKGLIARAEYRPSKATRIRHILSLLDIDSQKLALAIIHGRLEPEDLFEKDLDVETKIRILDLVMEFVQHQYADKDLTKEQYVDLFLKASKLRATLGKPADGAYNITRPVQPEEGHKPNRLSIGIGQRGWNDLKEKSLFQEIQYRPTYHDLMDSDKGYIKGAQIEFFSGSLRYYYDIDKVVLENFNLVNIFSVSSRNRFFKHISWRVRTGLKQADLSDGDRTLVYYLNTGGGIAYENSILGMYYAMFEPEIALGGGLTDNFQIGFGASFGLIKEVIDGWKIHLFLRPFYFALGETHESLEWALLQRYALATNLALSADLSGKEAAGRYQTEARLLLHIYF